MGDDDNHKRHTAADSATEDEMTKKTTPARGVDEFGQGPRRAIAKAVAHPLGVQPKYKQAL
jgi:hypothetical protein